MSTFSIVHIRNPRLLDWAVYLTLSIMVTISLIGLVEPVVRAGVVVLCLAFGLVHRYGYYAITAPRHALAYFVAQTALVLGLIGLAKTSDAFGFMFFILGVQAVLVLSDRAAVAWIVMFYLIESGNALLVRGADGVVNTLFNAAAYFFTWVFGYAIRQAEVARRQNEQLLAELRAAQSGLQNLAVAEERNRLARDLHDSVKQQVFAIIMQLGAARALVERDPPAARAHLDEAEGLARQSGAELSLLIHELRPVALAGKGLAEALRIYVAGWSRQSGIAASVHGADDLPLPPPVEQALLRVVQEALANVARHSQAATVVVGLEYGADVVLTIADDGRGFDLALAGDGVGLASMRERIEALGGRLRLASAAGEGTSVVATVPTGADTMAG